MDADMCGSFVWLATLPLREGGNEQSANRVFTRAFASDAFLETDHSMQNQRHAASTKSERMVLFLNTLRTIVSGVSHGHREKQLAYDERGEPA